jgi:hypothetical protein
MVAPWVTEELSVENSEFLIKGLIGLAIAAPVGPISVLCIRRTLADGRLIGLLTGLGGPRPMASMAPSPHSA